MESSNKHNLIILNSNYPSNDNLYGDVFVHSRLKHYNGIFNITVLGYRPFDDDSSYDYEGISVFNYNTKEKYIEAIKFNKPNIIGIHFVGGWLYDKFLKYNKDIPVVIWIHGEEALGWYRRLYNYNITSIFKLGLFAAKNIYQLYHLRRIIKHSNKFSNTQFIFVSKWMKRITEIDTFCKIKSYDVIPNPIDTDLFTYNFKDRKSAKKVLLIRSFETKKYANDIAIDSILLLSKRKIFKDLTFDLYGKGRYFKKLTDPLKKFSNIKLHNYFISNINIPEVHKKHGIFLCPTRQDAQGVSMCEAMSSGLVTISSNNTAIPEFIEHMFSGILTNNPLQIADSIEKLVNDGELFQNLSKNASVGIAKKSGHRFVIESEINILLKAVS
jgi:glycosyltransferase involved in cell wall biosynthesis